MSPNSAHVSRRQFFIHTGMIGLSVGFGLGCRSKADKPATGQAPGSSAGVPEGASVASVANIREAPPKPFLVVEAHGSPMEIGEAMGAGMRQQILASLEIRRRWFEDLKSFALADRGARIDAFVAATEKHLPDVMAEIRGIAKGAGMNLDDILVLNLQPELSALKAASTCGDCSTLHLVDGDRVLLAHNEDDDDGYRHHMTILRVRPNGKPRFVSLAYPGLIPGNVPAMNEAGVIRTTNYIGAKTPRPGLPRYVLGRAALGARSVDEAIAILTHTQGAYSFHQSLGSTKEKRLVSLEVGPGGVHDKHEVRSELFVHTNHYVLAGMKDVPQIASYAGGSSDSRYQILSRAMKTLPPLSQVTLDHLLRLLSSHDAVEQPFSPCRHPSGKVTGRTVATALFDVTAGTFTLLEGNPCENRRRAVELG